MNPAANSSDNQQANSRVSRVNVPTIIWCHSNANRDLAIQRACLATMAETVPLQFNICRTGRTHAIFSSPATLIFDLLDPNPEPLSGCLGVDNKLCKDVFRPNAPYYR